MRHKFLVLSVKRLLKSVNIYHSYRKFKTGGGHFMEHPVEYALSTSLQALSIPHCQVDVDVCTRDASVDGSA